MFDPIDPTAAAVKAPKLPMTPEQLDALRPKPVVAGTRAETVNQTAYRLAVPLEIVQRIAELESQVRNLVTLIPQLLEVAGVKVQ